MDINKQNKISNKNEIKKCWDSSLMFHYLAALISQYFTYQNTEIKFKVKEESKK